MGAGGDMRGGGGMAIWSSAQPSGSRHLVPVFVTPSFGIATRVLEERGVWEALVNRTGGLPWRAKWRELGSRFWLCCRPAEGLL